MREAYNNTKNKSVNSSFDYSVKKQSTRKPKLNESCTQKRSPFQKAPESKTGTRKWARCSVKTERKRGDISYSANQSCDNSSTITSRAQCNMAHTSKNMVGSIRKVRQEKKEESSKNGKQKSNVTMKEKYKIQIKDIATCPFDEADTFEKQEKKRRQELFERMKFTMMSPAQKLNFVRTPSPVLKGKERYSSVH